MIALTLCWPKTITCSEVSQKKNHQQVVVHKAENRPGRVRFIGHHGQGVDISTSLNAGLGTGRLVRSLEGHTKGVLSVAVTPDGSQAVCGSRDRTVKVWEIATGRLVRSLEGHTETV